MTSDRSDASSYTRPRVLYLLTSDLSAMFVRGQLAALRDAGFDVHLATNWQASDPKVDDGVTMWTVPFEREPKPFADLRALLSCIALVRRVRPDIVHASTPKAGLIGILSSWLTRVPTRLYVLHGLRYETAHGLARRIYKSSERLAAACAHQVLSDSESMRRRAIDDRLVSPHKIAVLGPGSANGVDTTRFSPAQGDDGLRDGLGLSRFRVVIGFVGRMTHDKGVDDLVSIFQQRFGHRPDIGLLLVGPIERSDPVDRSTLSALSKSEQIVHIPWLADTVEAYRAMDVLAFPSYREGLPNVPLEAQACGVPVVGYSATGTVDAVPDRRSLTTVGNKQGLGDLLEASVGNDPKKRQLAKEARQFALRFDQRAVWERKIRLLREMHAPRATHLDL